MTANLSLLDAVAATKVVKTTEVGNVHTPHNKAELQIGGADVAVDNRVPVTDSAVATLLATLATAAGQGNAKTVLDNILASLTSAVAKVDTTILINTSLTAEIDLAGARLARIALPAAWTTADLTFAVSFDGTTFNDLYDEFGVEVVVKAAASRSIRLNLTDWIGIKKLKIRSGTTATPVNQTAARALSLITVA